MGKTPPPAENEYERIDDARNSLLAMYSSKSTNETAILIGLAVAFLTVIQFYSVIENTIVRELRITYLTFFAGLFILLAMRAVGRLVYYGELATVIHFVEVKDIDEALDGLQKWQYMFPEARARDIKLVPAYLSRLAGACQDCIEIELRKKKSPEFLTYRISKHKYFKLVYVILWVAVYILLLTLL